MKKTIIALVLFLSLPGAAGAATASLVHVPQEIGVGDTVAVLLRVSSGVSVNTFSGSLRYPKEKLEFVSLNDGNSIVSLWLARPTNQQDGIEFSGLVPGGYSGDDGLLFTSFFKAKGAGTAAISLERAIFLRNDGAGGSEPVSSGILSLTIGGTSRGSFNEGTDIDPPEPFQIQLGKNPDIFDGRSYAAFTTTDKGSGVSYYEIAEQRIPFLSLQWKLAESPSALADQYLTSDIYVKAIDNAGNERVEVYPRTHVLRAYEMLILLGILMTVLFTLYVKKSI